MMEAKGGAGGGLLCTPIERQLQVEGRVTITKLGTRFFWAIPSRPIGQGHGAYEG